MPMLKVDLSELKNIDKKFYNERLVSEIMKIPQMKSIAALVSQAINDNFEKEGPGWAPLKPQTIRRGVAKSLRKKMQKLTGDEVVKLEKLLRNKSPSKQDVRDLSFLQVKMGIKPSKALKLGEPTKRILQKTGLLKKTATVIGFAGSNKVGATGSNVYRVEGTNLVWGTNLIYAGVHNNGYPKKNIPQREFLKIREEWMNRIMDFAAEKAMQIIMKELK